MPGALLGLGAGRRGSGGGRTRRLRGDQLFSSTSSRSNRASFDAMIAT